MQIRFFCPECDARVSARDDEAGSYVECRKCGTEVRVPKASSRNTDRDDDGPRSRSRRRDDDDDRDRRSRKASSKKKKKKSKLPLILALAGAAVVGMLIIGGAAAVYFYNTDPTDTKKIAGETWYKPDEKNSMFSAYFPGGTPDYDRVGFKPPAFIAKKAGGDPEDLAWSIQSWVRKNDGREYAVFLLKNPVGGQDADFMARMSAVRRDGNIAGTKVLSDEQITLTGHQGRRIVTRGAGETRAMMTFPLGSRYVLVIYVAGSDDFDHTDPKVAAFFDNLTLN